MTDQIKWTALNTIGNGLAPTNVLALVDMAGTPTSKRGNVQIVGNMILSNAGGTFSAAALSNVALSVANAAQPNITSVGTLTSLTVTANISAGNVAGGNLVSANFFSGNANGLFGVPVANVTGLGNIATINSDGNSSNVLLGSGTFGATPLSANVVQRVATPGSSSASGTAGQIAFDSGGNFFVCVATNTWSKFAGNISWP